MKIIRSGIHLQRNPIPNKKYIYIYIYMVLTSDAGDGNLLDNKKEEKSPWLRFVFGKRETIIHIIIIDLFKYKHHNYHYEYKIV